MALVAITVSTSHSFATYNAAGDKISLERGRYLMRIAGCNDCHTPGYAHSGGNVPEDQ